MGDNETMNTSNNAEKAVFTDKATELLINGNSKQYI